MLSRRLATLLEGAGCFLFFCEVKYSLYFKFGGKKAVKLENEVNIELSCCCWLSVITKNKGLSVFCLVILPLTWLLVLNPQKKKKYAIQEIFRTNCTTTTIQKIALYESMLPRGLSVLTYFTD